MLLLLAGLCLIEAAVIGYQAWMLGETQKKLLRMFSVQHSVPIPSMEGKPEAKTVVQAPPRKKISIPIPYAFRPTQTKQ